ncbi:MAG: FxsA family protein [Hyphomicrobiaceae bacterium]
MLIIILLLIVVPLVELAILIQVGGMIGVLPTILLVISISVAGGYLIRSQGLSALRRTEEAMRSGRPPLDSVIDGMGLLVAGTLLLTPGLLTDAIGILLLVPRIRRLAARFLFDHMLKRSAVDIRVFRSTGRPSSTPREPPPGTVYDDGEGTVIEGEYTRLDEEKGKRNRE